MAPTINLAARNAIIACIIVDGDPRFKTKQVPSVLGYVNANRPIRKQVDTDIKQTMECETQKSGSTNDNPGLQQQNRVIKQLIVQSLNKAMIICF